jgi:hypothetical protein
MEWVINILTGALKSFSSLTCRKCGMKCSRSQITRQLQISRDVAFPGADIPFAADYSSLLSDRLIWVPFRYLHNLKKSGLQRFSQQMIRNHARFCCLISQGKERNLAFLESAHAIHALFFVLSSSCTRSSSRRSLTRQSDRSVPLRRQV